MRFTRLNAVLELSKIIDKVRAYDDEDPLRENGFLLRAINTSREKSLRHLVAITMTYRGQSVFIDGGVKGTTIRKIGYANALWPKSLRVSCIFHQVGKVS